ncbi:2-octaprenyl-6-methoxyphenyl hydroxylase [uncultured Porticoccus sp.]|uniref:2-octaprenyl-6-methoxyphenyl hydroxylase n=1 Tax=uncultured Porticoccus sp. TaxID=1256050 RepID=UPI0030DC8C00
MKSRAAAESAVDIAIVGGGMVGASLALLLSHLKADWRIRVIESFPLQSTATLPPSFDGRSTALSHSSREIFELLGLWQSLHSGLTEIRQVHVSDRGHFGRARLTAAEQNLPALGYVVENRQLGDVLMAALQRAPGVEVTAPAQVVAVSPSSRGMQLQVSSDDTDAVEMISADLLVVADGAQSQTRQRLAIDSRCKDYGQAAVVANIGLQLDHGGIAYERFTDLGPMAMLPLQPMAGEHRCAMVWTMPPEQAAELLAADEAEFLARLQQRFGYRLGPFVRVGSRQVYPLSLITSEEQVRRHLVVVGNAAHSLHPVAGQGFNLALRDVAVLAETLGEAAENHQAPGELSVLQEYLQRQQLDQQQTILLSDLLPRVFGMHSIPMALLRNTGLLALDAVPLLRHQFTRLGMGLETRGTPMLGAMLGNTLGNTTGG